LENSSRHEQITNWIARAAMSIVGLGYDLSATTYSPEGRVFQIEYGMKAVDNSRTCLGIKVKDGIILAAEKIVSSPLIVPGSNRRVSTIDMHIGMVSSGVSADSRQLLKRAREEARNYRDSLNEPIPGKVLAERIGLFVQTHTLYSSVRPFGSTIIIGSKDLEGCSLHMIDPSGQQMGYFGCVAGKGQQIVRTELEKLKLDELSSLDGVKEAVRVLYLTLDGSSDKRIEIDLSWICEESGYKHELVPEIIVKQAEDSVRRLLLDGMEF
jgi:20S proteasome subunit alpha 7